LGSLTALILLRPRRVLIAMTGRQDEAVKKLRGDMAFFRRMISKAVIPDTPRARADDPVRNWNHDVYLMETQLTPLLLQGLDALTQHVEKLASGRGEMCCSARAPFNPLIWLAQYLMRNHPGKRKDERSIVYEELGELADQERARRFLLQREAKFKELWQTMQKRLQRQLTSRDLPELFETLDRELDLEGALCRRMPPDLTSIVEADLPAEVFLTFAQFWAWFQRFLTSTSLFRVSEFEAPERRRAMQKQRKEEAILKLQAHEQVCQTVRQRRSQLLKQFANLSAEFHHNDGIVQILNKSLIIHVGEDHCGPGATAPSGSHIDLIASMLGLWGFPVEPACWGTWTAAAAGPWRSWKQAYCADSGDPHVNADSLRKLIDANAFAQVLEQMHPIPTLSSDGCVGVEVLQLLQEDRDDDVVVVEVLHDETGEHRQLMLPREQADEVQRRLQSSDEPVLGVVHADAPDVVMLQSTEN